MADEGNVISDLNLNNGADNAPSAGIISQYIKDLSVENPNAPVSFQWQDQPSFDVQFNIGARSIEGEVHEVELKITCTPKTEAGTAFIVDLTYAGLFGLRNIPEEHVQPFLLDEAPRLLFPFARRVLSDCVRDGGFAPLLLDPIDFAQLYMQQAEARAASTSAEVGHA